MFNLEKFLITYDFSNSLNWAKSEILTGGRFEDQTKNFSPEILQAFSDDFWGCQGISVSEIKTIYEIPNYIGFSDILKVFHNPKYNSLLKSIWSSDQGIDDIIAKFGITYANLCKLVLPVIFEDSEVSCGICLRGHKFIIKGDLNEIKKQNTYIQCDSCSGYLNDDSFIPTSKAQKDLAHLKEEYQKVHEYAEKVQQALNDEYKCYICQNANFRANIVETSLVETPFQVQVQCKSCLKTWQVLNEFVLGYKEWQKKAAMMIAIKQHEMDLIAQSLKLKNANEVNFAQEEIILDDDLLNTETRSFHLDIHAQTNGNVWGKIFEKLKLCSRVEKLILIKIIEICLKKGSEKQWHYKNTPDNQVGFYYFEFDSPIVIALFEETKFLNIRKALKGLMSKSLILCGEQKNFVEVSAPIAQKLDLIKKLLEPQNIQNELKQLVFARDRFTCYHCGETGRPLKISFLSAKKDTANLNDMVSLCDTCHLELSENDVLIDGTISSLVNEDLLPQKISISFGFIKTLLPEFATDESALYYHEQLLEEFDEVDILKSMAITLSVMEDKNISTVKGFYAYTKGILNNSKDRETGVTLSKRINDMFKVDSWISRI